MSEDTPAEPAEEERPPKHSLGERLREHLLAAEVAAEESAGYGAATTIVEAAETAVDPEHELGDSDDDADATKGSASSGTQEPAAH